jgi:hypothetical protein
MINVTLPEFARVMTRPANIPIWTSGQFTPRRLEKRHAYLPSAVDQLCSHDNRGILRLINMWVNFLQQGRASCKRVCSKSNIFVSLHNNKSFTGKSMILLVCAPINVLEDAYEAQGKNIMVNGERTAKFVSP